MAVNPNYDPFQASASEVNKFLADELNNLSFEQREAMLEVTNGRKFADCDTVVGASCCGKVVCCHSQNIESWEIAIACSF
mmetsp:Transcript_24493/g.58100  ORF Transcript_24493/g.58100 Transcript_24493/m.58100 type:complete len:80 (+) Transcript_24493:124-363(+)